MHIFMHVCTHSPKTKPYKVKTSINILECRKGLILRAPVTIKASAKRSTIREYHQVTVTTYK